jgi:hypothetical protein
MTITFENDKDVIVYALEKVISFARDNQYIFLAQSIWWISSIIGLQEGFIIHIDNLKARGDVGLAKEVPDTPEGEIVVPDDNIHTSRRYQIQRAEDSYIESDEESDSTTETNIHNEVIRNCETFLAQSQKERKAGGRFTRLASRRIKNKADRKARRIAKEPISTFGTQTEGIDGSELTRRKAAGECQRCAYPHGEKGSHTTIDCRRNIKFKKGTAAYHK